jgi:tRNA U55 pseudouridine synthase TruB
LEDTIKHYKGRQKILETIFKMYEGLHERRTVSLKELLAAQVEVLGTSIQLDNQNISIIENRQSILATQAEKDAFISDWDRQIAEKIVENERNITAYLREIPKYEMYVSMTELRAPCDSVVHELAPFQEGSAVREAEALVTLIPIDSEVLLAEIDIPARDIKIYNYEILSEMKLVDNHLEVDILLDVSKGFYVRSFARDLGKLLGGCAIMKELRRIKTGYFDIKMANKIENITTNNIVSIYDIFKFKRVQVNDYIAKLVKNGIILDERQVIINEPFYVINNNEVIAIYEPFEENKYKPLLIF